MLQNTIGERALMTYRTTIGIPKEIKDHEYRVGATPSLVKTLVEVGHTVIVETNAGAKIGFSDAMYQKAGASIVSSPSQVYDAEMIVKVKEPQLHECDFLHEGQIIFGYLHLSPEPVLTRRLLEKKIVAIAYETVVDKEGKLPLLLPMSEIAGRIAIQAGATALQLPQGGKGILMGGISGVSPAKVAIIGGGAVGTEAARMAMGLGADVTVLDNHLNRLRHLDALYGPKLKTLYAASDHLEQAIIKADLVVGAILLPGKLAPKLITRQMVSQMSPGSVIVDVAIDQGGCSETSKPTTHSNPTYVLDGVVHYCVTNMPGACSFTATQALTNATMNYVLQIANKGYKAALTEDPGLKKGLNLCLGNVTLETIAQDHELPYVAPEQFL